MLCIIKKNKLQLLHYFHDIFVFLTLFISLTKRVLQTYILYGKMSQCYVYWTGVFAILSTCHPTCSIVNVAL